MSADTPTISLVTPCYQQRDLIRATLSSVIEQGYPNLEYVVIDGGSTDGSAEIIAGFEDHLHHWVSEPDDGHYPALNKGFAKTHGEIMGYLNGDDLLLPGALSVVAEIFSTFPSIDWITGAHFAIDEAGRTVGLTGAARWSQWHIVGDAAGRLLPQESTFWRRSLWERAGGKIDESFPLAADFELWARFARFSAPAAVQVPLAAFRYVAGQRSIAQGDRYAQEVAAVRERERSRDSSVGDRVARADRLIRLARKPGMERLRPIVESVLGAPHEIAYDPSSGSFVQRGHAGRGARRLVSLLKGTLGRNLAR